MATVSDQEIDQPADLVQFYRIDAMTTARMHADQTGVRHNGQVRREIAGRDSEGLGQITRGQTFRHMRHQELEDTQTGIMRQSAKLIFRGWRRDGHHDFISDKVEMIGNSM